MNTIKIKYGMGNPAGKLAPYELGYSTDGKSLYIGLPDNEVQNLSNFVPLNASSTPTIFTNNGTALNIRGNSSETWLGFLDKDNKALGYYGVNANGQPIFWDKDSKNLVYNGMETITSKSLISDSVTAGKLWVGSNSYGKKDPNIAGTNGAALSGTTGQLYFVITG